MNSCSENLTLRGNVMTSVACCFATRGNVYLHILSNSRHPTPHDLFTVSPGIHIKFFIRSNVLSYFEVGIDMQVGKLNLMLRQIHYFLMALLFWVKYYQYIRLFSLNIWSAFSLGVKTLSFVIELSWHPSFNLCLEMWVIFDNCLVTIRYFDVLSPCHFLGSSV